MATKRHPACVECGAAGKLWEHHGRWWCDAHLSAQEERIAKRLGPGMSIVEQMTYRRRKWVEPASRPMTEDEATRPVRSIMLSERRDSFAHMMGAIHTHDGVRTKALHANNYAGPGTKDLTPKQKRERYRRERDGWKQPSRKKRCQMGWKGSQCLNDRRGKRAILLRHNGNITSEHSHLAVRYLQRLGFE